jgi:hypothetical protein
MGEYPFPVPETAEKNRTWCEIHDGGTHPAFVLLNVFADAIPVQRQSEAPEVPSFLLVGAGLLLLRFPLRRR